MMNSPDALLYEYSVVRYVPRVDREEFINIGLIMMCKRQKWLKGKINIDKNRILAFDPQANPDVITSQAIMFENPALPSPVLPVEEKYRWLSAVKSAVLQTSPSHPAIAIDDSGNGITPLSILESEFKRLFRDLVL